VSLSRANGTGVKGMDWVPAEANKGDEAGLLGARPGRWSSIVVK
jgi:hypothetical protein